MKTSSLRRAARALGTFAAASVALGMAAVPGVCLTVWAFRLFLIDAVFTGGFPKPGDAALFSFFLGTALCLFVPAASLVLAGGCRLLRPFRRGAGFRGPTGGLLESFGETFEGLLEAILGFLPNPATRSFFHRLSGRD